MTDQPEPPRLSGLGPPRIDEITVTAGDEPIATFKLDDLEVEHIGPVCNSSRWGGDPGHDTFAGPVPCRYLGEITHAIVNPSGTAYFTTGLWGCPACLVVRMGPVL